jgi:hypothetical protein
MVTNGEVQTADSQLLKNLFVRRIGEANHQCLIVGFNMRDDSIASTSVSGYL